MGKKFQKNENSASDERQPYFNSLHKLRAKVKDGTYREILDDWKWIFTYTKRHKGAVVFYTILGLLSSTLAMVSSVATKYVIDIITSRQTEKLALLIAIVVGGAVFALVFRSVINRLSVKLSININNDIQADIFDPIIDVDWKAINA